MEPVSHLFEAAMIVCFGASWPAEIWKTATTKDVEGISAAFLWLVFAGYLSGIMFKIAEGAADGGLRPVTALYVLNAAMVGAEIILFYRYRRW